MVVGCFEYYDSEGKFLDVVFMLEAFIDRQKSVEPALDLGDENVVRLPRRSKIPHGFDYVIRKKRAKTRSKAGIDALVDQDSAHSATKSCTSSR